MLQVIATHTPVMAFLPAALLRCNTVRNRAFTQIRVGEKYLENRELEKNIYEKRVRRMSLQ